MYVSTNQNAELNFNKPYLKCQIKKVLLGRVVKMQQVPVTGIFYQGNGETSS